MKKELIKKSYQLAKEQYAELGVDTDKVLKQMDDVVISLHCWQTDDVGGFEKEGAELGGGGIQATGNFPGKAKTIGQMRDDLDKVMSLLPGKQRLNLHAIYGEFGGKTVDRNQIELKHFQGWINWAKKRKEIKSNRKSRYMLPAISMEYSAFHILLNFDSQCILKPICHQASMTKLAWGHIAQ